VHPTSQEHPVNQPETEATPTPTGHSPRRWIRWVVGTGSVLLLLLIAAGIATEWAIRNAEPILRRRVIQTLSARFNSPVKLDHLQLSYSQNLMVKGSGLRILYLAGPTKPDASPNAPPMLTVPNFEFTIGIRELLHPTTRVVTVRVQGMQIDIPPRPEQGPPRPDNPKRRSQPRWGIAVDKIICTDTKLVIETSKPEKKPLIFNISSLTLTDVGANKPFNYEAELINPKPVGNIQSTGHFGPWQDDNPRDTPLDGTYQFTHADLSSIRGIAGILSSTGRFTGTLGSITVNGTTNTPDFRLDISQHPVALHTDFHALVDGTTGDTRLNPVKATVLHSQLTASGSVIRSAGVPGHDTELDIVIDRGRIEDMLVLSMKSSPPLLRGALALRTHISVPPGPVSVSKKLRMKGTLSIREATFSDPLMQQKIQDLSMRAQGKPHLANPTDAQAITFAMSGDFVVTNTIAHITNLTYQIPGANIDMYGEYSLGTSVFDFHGIVRTQATASQMTTGWKSLLLTPFDSMLKKNGAGLELPIHVAGANSSYDIRLDYGHAKRLPKPEPSHPK
jgi:hypothetical protein